MTDSYKIENIFFWRWLQDILVVVLGVALGWCAHTAGFLTISSLLLVGGFAFFCLVSGGLFAKLCQHKVLDNADVPTNETVFSCPSTESVNTPETVPPNDAGYISHCKLAREISAADPWRAAEVLTTWLTPGADTPANQAVEQVSVVLRSLDPSIARQVIECFNVHQAKTVANTMLAQKMLGCSGAEKIIQHFVAQAKQHVSFGVGAKQAVRELFSEPVAADAETRLESQRQGNEVRSTLAALDVATIKELLFDEHPQVIAVALTQLEKAQASELLAHFPVQIQADILARIADLRPLQPPALLLMAEELDARCSSMMVLQSVVTGGVQHVADILLCAKQSAKQAIIHAITESDKNLAGQLHSLDHSSE